MLNRPLNVNPLVSFAEINFALSPLFLILLACLSVLGNNSPVTKQISSSFH